MIQDTGYMIHDTGIQEYIDTGYRIQEYIDTGYRIQDIRIQDTGYRMTG